MSKIVSVCAIVGVLINATAQTAVASSDDAWDEFRQVLIEKCSIAAKAGKDSLVQIDPFGTQSYGVAIIYTASGRQVCIMNKQTTEIELSEPF